jgi:hypothetical protein
MITDPNGLSGRPREEQLSLLMRLQAVRRFVAADNSDANTGVRCSSALLSRQHVRRLGLVERENER